MATQQYTWKVTGQTQTEDFSSGDGVPGVDIRIEVSNGWTGTVFVPNTVYPHPDQVRELITEKVKQVLANHNMSGTITA